MRFSHRLSFILLVPILCGCSDGVDSDGWSIHTLTEVQYKRQDELLTEIRWDISAKDLLAGKPAADYQELLSLADKSKTDDKGTSYAYNVLAGGGGGNEPGNAVIVVANDKIARAYWPYGEF